MMGECLVSGYDEYADVSDTRVGVRGRKDYKCCECRRVIPKGVPHENVKHLYEGGWSSVRTCDLCRHVRDSLFKGGCAFGELWESVQEAYREDRHNDGPELYGWLDPPTRPIPKPHRSDPKPR